MPNLEGEMVAYRWFPGAKTLTKAKVAIPEPADDEVLVKVLAAGMCHSDMLYYDVAFEHTRTEPFTMGHEGAGVVIALGKHVPSSFPDVHVNQYVVIHGRNPCLSTTCPVCSTNADNLCTQYYPYGLGIDGCYAPYVTVAARAVVPVNATEDIIPPPLAAVSTDAVLTSYHALKDLRVGEIVLVVGVGGLGINAVQIAKYVRNAKVVIASDTRDIMLRKALEVGADYAVKPHELQHLLSSNNLSIDTACDFVGSATSFRSVLEHVRSRGTIIVVGLGEVVVELPLVSAAKKEVTIKTSMWGTKKELAEVLALVKEKKITPLTETKPLDQAIEVFENMRLSKLQGRVVLIPGQ
ncbi:alcohol dehydogenase [Lentinula raphanica]|uniref:Alcohol dehydogenase n=1 Tax=Lentinula raphanica TaxID=153919 RepID=A0AA38UAQ6_9AGAR|nr:alcohol dehydogenase [Lentinula raphanica]